MILRLVTFMFPLILSFRTMFSIPWLWVMTLWLLAGVFLLAAAGSQLLQLDCPGWCTLLNLLQLPLLGCFLLGTVLALHEHDNTDAESGQTDLIGFQTLKDSQKRKLWEENIVDKMM